MDVGVQLWYPGPGHQICGEVEQVHKDFVAVTGMKLIIQINKDRK